MFISARTLIFTAVLMLASHSLQAVDFTWDVDGDGLWDLTGNWDVAGFPDASTDNATITNPFSATNVIVTVGPSETRVVNNLVIADNGVAWGRMAGELKQRLRAARPAKLRDWDVECAAWSAAARRWSADELDAALAAAAAADRSLKSTTVSDERGILTSMVLALPATRAAA